MCCPGLTTTLLFSQTVEYPTLSQPSSNLSYPEALSLVPEPTVGKHPNRAGRWLQIFLPGTVGSPSDKWARRLTHSLYRLSTYLPLIWRVSAGQEEGSLPLVGPVGLRNL